VIFEIEVGGTRRKLEVRRDATGFTVLVDGRPVVADVSRIGRVWSLLIGRDVGHAGDAGRPMQSYEITIDERPDGATVVYVNGQPIPVSIIAPASGPRLRSRSGGDAAGAAGPQRVVAPMPGKIIKVLVKQGDVVVARQGLVVVEAMKMENELRSPKAGTVVEVRAAEGSSVEAGAVLVVVE
jgi:biotin carboxyl carrier protein